MPNINRERSGSNQASVVRGKLSAVSKDSKNRLDLIVNMTNAPSRKHLLISIITFTLGLTLLLVRYFNMGIYAAWFSLGLYMLCYSFLLFAGFMSKRWLHVKVENATV